MVVIGMDVVCGVGRHGNGVVVVEIGMWETGWESTAGTDSVGGRSEAWCVSWMAVVGCGMWETGRPGTVAVFGTDCVAGSREVLCGSGVMVVGLGMWETGRESTAGADCVDGNSKEPCGSGVAVVGFGMWVKGRMCPEVVVETNPVGGNEACRVSAVVGFGLWEKGRVGTVVGVETNPLIGGKEALCGSGVMTEARVPGGTTTASILVLGNGGSVGTLGAIGMKLWLLAPDPDCMLVSGMAGLKAATFFVDCGKLTEVTGTRTGGLGLGEGV